MRGYRVRARNARSRVMPAEHQNTLTSTRDNSTSMDPYQAAIDEIESLEPGEDYTYTEVAARRGLCRSTLG
jgi:hypothetical protein